MIVLGIDLETTGFDVNQERITELGYVVWDTDKKTSMYMQGAFLYNKSYEEKFTPEITEMMQRVCGITPDMLRYFGRDPLDELTMLDRMCDMYKVEYIIAHNGNNYDRPLLLAELSRNGVNAPVLRERLWLDTLTDIPFPTPPESRKLKYLACDHGFINPFAHRAVFDVLTMLTLMSQYKIEDVIAYSKIPTKIMRAMVSYDDREKAKAMKFMWEKVGDKTFNKSWVKAIKEDKVASEIDACKKQGFQAVVIA